MVSLPTVHPVSEIVGRAAQLARAFRERGLPVVLVSVKGRALGRTDAGAPKFSFPPDWTEILPELEEQAGDHLATKQRVGAFVGTSLDDHLRERGVTQVVLAGISTSGGVESTARSAYDLGHNVTFVVDAITDRDADAHRHCVENIFPRLGEAAKRAAVLKLLKIRDTHISYFSRARFTLLAHILSVRVDPLSLIFLRLTQRKPVSRIVLKHRVKSPEFLGWLFFEMHALGL
jgi:nicotinamidase-related amidase